MVATAVTHPQMWTLAIWSYGRFPYWPAILTIEALVVVVEAALIAWMARLTPARAGIVSLVANSASFLFGLWLTALSAARDRTVAAARKIGCRAAATLLCCAAFKIRPET